MSTSDDNPKKRTRTDGVGDGGTVASEEEAPRESKYHRGKWTNEECEYMLGLMEAFKAGHLPLREGTTLRSFLSSMMKCKPKRISKKFEGISYNGRMVFQKSKEPMSIQAAMLLRAQLSELERRYLAAAAEQRDGNDSIEALLKREPVFQNQEASPFACVFEQQPVAAAVASLPSLDQATARLQESTLASSIGLGLGLGSEANPSKDMAGLLGGQGLDAMSALRGVDPSLFNSAASTNTSLLSAGLAAGNGAYRLLSQQRPAAAPQAEFPQLAGPPSQSFLSDFHSHLREMEQKQKLANLSNTNAVSTLAALQLRERNLAEQLSQTSSGGGLSFSSSLRNEVLPSVPAGLNAERLRSLPGAGPPNDSLSSVQHTLDLNRYVLQSPQDDATYFRQRLLPGMGSVQNNADAQTRLETASRASVGASDLFASLSAPAPGARSLAELLSLHTQEGQKLDGLNLKRQRY